MEQNLNNSRIYLFIMLTILFQLLLTGCSTNSQLPVIDLDKPTEYTGITTIFSEPNPGEQDEKFYTFGFERRLQTKEDVKMYVPLLKYLEEQTGMRFKLHITPKQSWVADQIAVGKVDFAAMGSLGFLRAKEKAPVKILVKGNNDKGGFYQAAIFARKESSIASLSDIKGHSFAFGSETSTQGHLIPRIMLQKSNIQLKDLSRYAFYNSHAEVANAVLKGDYEVGALQDTLARSLVAQGLGKIIATSGDYPSSGIVAGPNVPEDVAEKVRTALLAFDPLNKDVEGLYHWELSEMPLGFVNINDEEYQKLFSDYLASVRR